MEHVSIWRNVGGAAVVAAILVAGAAGSMGLVSVIAAGCLLGLVARGFVDGCRATARDIEDAREGADVVEVGWPPLRWWQLNGFITILVQLVLTNAIFAWMRRGTDGGGPRLVSILRHDPD